MTQQHNFTFEYIQAIHAVNCGKIIQGDAFAPNTFLSKDHNGFFLLHTDAPEEHQKQPLDNHNFLIYQNYRILESNDIC